MHGLGDYRLDPPDDEDYAEVVKRFCRAHEQEIDNILDACAEIEPDARELDISDFRDAADRVADFIGVWLIGFKRTDRLSDKRKGKHESVNGEHKNANNAGATAHCSVCG